jgi:peptidoglycan/xylan/chitin deacetylase (PgdA/CDA1 family)
VSARPETVRSGRGDRSSSAARFRALVLCFHAVSDEWEHPLAIPVGRLERILRAFLLRRYRAVDAERAVAGGRRLLHVTFDDAYTNVLAAIPVLERLAVPATVFACSGYADAGGRPLDVPELAAEVAADSEPLRTMSWDQLRELAERDVEIGAHTVTHPHLCSLADADVDRELRDSRTRIEDELRRPCRYLAYPYGEADGRIAAAARRAGYDAAFVLHGRARGASPHLLPRVDLYRRDSTLRAMLKALPQRELAWRMLDTVDRRRSRRWASI